MAFLKPLNNVVEIASAEETPELPDPYLLWNVQYDLQPDGPGIYYYDGTNLQKLAPYSDIVQFDTWWRLNGVELFFTWQDGVTPQDPGFGRIAANAVQLSGATRLYISRETALGQAIAGSGIESGDEMLVSDQVKSALEQFLVNGAVIHPTWLDIDVTRIQGSSVNPNAGDFMSIRYLPPGII